MSSDPYSGYRDEMHRVADRLGRVSERTLRAMTLHRVRCPQGCDLGSVYETGGQRVRTTRSTGAHSQDFSHPYLIDRPDLPQPTSWYLQCRHTSNARIDLMQLKAALDELPRGAPWIIGSPGVP